MEITYSNRSNRRKVDGTWDVKLDMRTEEEVELTGQLALERLTERLMEIGERENRGGYVAATEDEVPESALECRCCLMPIEKGDLFMKMACCGAICHVMCMAKVANSHPLLMSHACPNCVQHLTKDEEEMLAEIRGVVKVFQKANDDEPG